MSSPTRVLLEHENPRILEAQAAALRQAGFEVTTCGGPAALPGRTCPLVPNGRCEAAERADVIVNGLPMKRLTVYVAQRTGLPHQRVLLGVSDLDRVRFPTTSRMANTVDRDLTGDEIVQAVRAALGDPAPAG